MRISLIFTIAFLVAALTACSSSDSVDYVVNDSGTNHITIQNGSVAVHAPNRDDAVITAAGALSIGRTDVTVTPPQRELLKRYYATTLAMRDHGKSVRKAGGSVAVDALTSVAAGLGSGNTKKVDSEVKARAAKITSAVGEMCNDLAILSSTQHALASQLAAFKPYAQIKATEANDCRRGLKDFARSKAPPSM